MHIVVTLEAPRGATRKSMIHLNLPRGPAQSAPTRSAVARAVPSMRTAQAWASAASHAGRLYVLSGGHKMQFHPDPMAGWGGRATHYDDRCWGLIE
jgi:hypothetical protein